LVLFSTGPALSQTLFEHFLCGDCLRNQLVFIGALRYKKTGGPMKKIDFMIFDFDGTLVDTGADLVKSINYTLGTLGLPERPAHEIISFVGDGVNKLMEKSLGKDHAGRHADAMKIFTDYYAEHLMDHTVLYPGVREILENYRNKTKMILTNKRHRFTMRIAESLKIEKYFADIIGADSMPFMKPDQRVMDHIFSKYPSAKGSAVVIGDGVNDVLIARKTGVLSCALLNGLGNRDELLKLRADYYCEDILELKDLFE